MKKGLTPKKIVSIYAVTGGLWILFSDRILSFLTADPEILTQFQTYKGWFFVAVTAVLLLWLIGRYAAENEKTIAALSESEAYNRDLFLHSPIGLAVCRMDGSLVDVNPAFAQIIGRSVEETLKLTYWDITPEKYADDEAKQLESLKLTGSYGPYEKEYVHKDGRLVQVRLQGRIIERNGEKFIWSSVEDITVRQKMEDELRLSEEKFAKVFRSSPDTILLTDISNGRIVEVNEAFCRRTGYSRDEAIGRTTLELNIWINENDRNRFIKELKEKGRIVDMEFLFRHRNDEIVTCLLFAETITLSGGTYMVGILRDITERKIAEKELRDRENQLRLFVEYSPAAIAMFDLKMKYIVASHRWLTDYNLGDVQIIGRSHYDIFPDIPERWMAIHKRCLAGAVERCEEDPFPRADGSIDWVRWEVHPWRHPEGTIGGIIIFSEVITERKKAEEALRESKLQLEMAVRASNTGLWDWDLKTSKVYFSPEWKRQIGYEEWEISDDFSEWQKRVHPDDLEQATATVNKCLETPCVNYENEFRFQCKNGRYIWIFAKASLLSDEHGKPVRILGSHLDITDRKRAEEEIRKLNVELEQRVKERTAELETKIAEIERMNRLFVGREMRMMELKERIKELENKVASCKSQVAGKNHEI
jgi:PAS domain S-box-containing protein